MNIFKIDDSTIGCGEAHGSPDGSRRVFILKTDTAEPTLSSTLRLSTPRNIWDTCHIRMADGTQCLLLCVPYDHSIMAVEIGLVGVKTRWTIGKKEMGEKFNPWSICIDDDNIVYVADSSQHMIHLLSGEDGSLIKFIKLIGYGIANLIAVRVSDQYLHVKHYEKPGDENKIRKFKFLNYF